MKTILLWLLAAALFLVFFSCVNDTVSPTGPAAGEVPDLAVGAIAVPDTFIADTIMTVSVTVYNVGTAATAESCTVTVVISPDSIISASDPRIATAVIPVLEKQESLTITIQVTIPDSLFSDSLFIGAVLDVNDDVEEKENGNNVAGAGDKLEVKFNNNDIPADPANVTVPAPAIDNIRPRGSVTAAVDGTNRVRINLQGILNPTTGEPLQLVADSTVFVLEDSVVQGIKVTKVGGSTTLAADIVFIVDNSGSMGEEADSVAATISRFVDTLTQSGLNLRFGCVGYSWNGKVNGALNFSSDQAIKDYLTNRGQDTTDRTVGFVGADSAYVKSRAYGFSDIAENGGIAIEFADSIFSWRTGAQRLFVNFTDEPQQSSVSGLYHTSNVCASAGLTGTIHTVWSGLDSASIPWAVNNEKPWLMSHCSGGTFESVDSSAFNLDLSKLRVTGAMSNSYLVEFVTSDPNVPHTVTIVITTSGADGSVEYVDVTY